MKRTFDHPNKLTLTVRTERGAISIDVGLEWLTRQERNYLFTLMKTAKEGGTIGFGVDPGEPGQSILKLTLGQAPAETPGIPLEAPAESNGTPS